MSNPPHFCPKCNERFDWDDAVLRDPALSAEEQCHGNAYWLTRWHVEKEHPEVAFTCPRQAGGALGGKSAFWQSDGTCSYCGSLSPVQFFEFIEAGGEVGPTDKSYKVYLNGEHAPSVRGAAKFYLQHLSLAEQDRFIDLYNAKKMKLGYPGNFYVTPFFCQRGCA